MHIKSLEDKIRSVGNPVDMLRNAPTGPYPFPIRPEFTNWRDEQRAWREGAILFDQSFHMTDHYIEGPGTKSFIESLAVNSMANWRRDIAKQVVFCNHDGRLIGDAIMFILEEEKVNIVNKPINRNWVQFNAEVGGFDVQCTTDFRVLDSDQKRLSYRFEIQGPAAWEICERMNGGPITGFKFFGMGEINVAGLSVRALRHGMAGAAGLEIFGPFKDHERVSDAIMEAGKDLGLRASGSRTYATAAHESGWFPSPLPAVYSGDKMKSYREWLGADSFEANLSLGGSFVSDSVEDYYISPYDIGYGHIVKFDHEFVGKDALQEMKDRPRRRRKRTLRWNKEDVLRVYASMMEREVGFKYMEMPAAHYATCPYDLVNLNGKPVGISHYPVYTTNVRSWISLALLDEAAADPGTEVAITWGEPDGGTAKPSVERHVQTEIRATVEPCPISVEVRTGYKS